MLAEQAKLASAISNVPPEMQKIAGLAIVGYLVALRAHKQERHHEPSEVNEALQGAAEAIQKTRSWEGVDVAWRDNAFLLLYASLQSQDEALDALLGRTASVFLQLEAVVDRLGGMPDAIASLIEGQQAIASQVKRLVEAQQPPLKAVDHRRGYSNDTDRLQYSRRATDMVGRDDDLNTLLAFLNTPDPFLWWIWTGAAGTGKSRLALEFIIAAQSQGWRAGFYDWEAGYMRWDLFDPDEKTLIVFDYAQRDPKQLGAEIERLTATPGLRNRVRFLLLERAAEDHEQWVIDLLRSAGAWKSTTQHAPTRKLEPLGDEWFRAVAYAIYSARVKYIAKRGEPMPPADFDKGITVAVPEAIQAELRPLFAQFVGEAVAVHDSFEEVRHWDMQTVAKWWLTREVERWKSAGLSEETLNLLVLATILGSVGDDDRRKWAADPALPLPAGPSVAHWADLFSSGARAEIGDVPTFGGLEPDMIGEALVLERLVHPCQLALARADMPGPAIATRALLKKAMLSDDFRSFLFTLRCVQDYPTHPALDTILQVAKVNNAEYYGPLVGLAVPALLVDRPERLAQLIDELETRWRVMAIIYKGITLGQLERREEAIAAFEAVLLFPDAPAELKAQALVYKGVTLGQLERPEEEMAAYEAVLLIPDAPAELKARALLGKGVILGQLERPEEEIAAYQAVLLIPDAPAEQKAKALVNKGVTLGQLERREEEIAAYEAVLLIPDAPAEQKAQALFYKGITLGQLERPEEEIAAYEAVLLIPDAPAEQKAKALVNKGVTLGQLGRREAAIAAFEAALLIPDAPAELKARALLGKGVILGQLERPEEEIAAYQAVLLIPDAPAEQKAKALVNKGVTLGQLGRREEAIAAFEAALLIPDAPAEQKAKALVNKGVTLGQLERREEAIAAYQAVLTMDDVSAEIKALVRESLSELGFDSSS